MPQVRDLPDFWEVIQPSRCILGPRQGWFKLTVSAPAIPAGGMAFFELTIPAGLRMYLSVLDVNCSASCIQRIKVLEDGVVLFNGAYDTFGKFYMPDLGADVYPPLKRVRFEIYNDDAVPRSFFVNLKWIYDEVG